MKVQYCVFIATSLLALTCIISSVDALSCVQCNNCPQNYTDVSECPPETSELCLKIFHKLTKKPNNPVIDRRCSNSTSSETLCSDITEGVTSCLYYCRTDGCNDAVPVVNFIYTWEYLGMSVFTYLLGARNIL